MGSTYYGEVLLTGFVALSVLRFTRGEVYTVDPNHFTFFPVKPVHKRLNKTTDL